MRTRYSSFGHGDEDDIVSIKWIKFWVGLEIQAEMDKTLLYNIQFLLKWKNILVLKYSSCFLWRIKYVYRIRFAKYWMKRRCMGSYVKKTCKSNLPQCLVLVQEYEEGRTGSMVSRIATGSERLLAIVIKVSLHSCIFLQAYYLLFTVYYFIIKMCDTCSKF